MFVLLATGCGSESPYKDNNNTGFKSQFVNDIACDTIIDKEFFEVCYDYKLKAAKSVAYVLAGDLVNESNIKDRPNFYEEELLNEEYRISATDYTNSGYDRGHMAPDAAFDWSQESLDATYSMANIIPQIPEVNREMWTDVEKYSRRKAVDLGTLNVINIVKYNPERSRRLGENRIAVSKGFYKVLYNEEEEFKECYFYENKPYEEVSKDKLIHHLVDCNTVSYN